MAVENNDKVAVHYTGKLDDGTVFDSSEGKEALESSGPRGHRSELRDDRVRRQRTRVVHPPGRRSQG